MSEAKSKSDAPAEGNQPGSQSGGGTQGNGATGNPGPAPGPDSGSGTIDANGAAPAAAPGGAMLPGPPSYAPAVHNNVLKHIVAVAQKEKIPFQRLAASRATGTDTDAFAYGAAGVPSALISLPLRYMHTTVETVHRQDVENVIRLILASVKALKPGADMRYFK